MEVTDLFFTNYTWNLDKLVRSVNNAGEKLNKLYHGIDIWGRGSYEGGQHNTWKGCKVCKDMNCSVALFAPGWTYEKADGNRHSFILSDDRLWLGNIAHQLYDPKKHSWFNEINGGAGWQTYYDDELSSNVAM